MEVKETQRLETMQYIVSFELKGKQYIQLTEHARFLAFPTKEEALAYFNAFERKLGGNYESHTSAGMGLVLNRFQLHLVHEGNLRTFIKKGVNPLHIQANTLGCFIDCNAIECHKLEGESVFKLLMQKLQLL